MLPTEPLDLLLDSSGDLVIVDGDAPLAVGVDGVAQLIRIAVLLVRGEWFLNLDAGIPYFERDGVPAAEAILGQAFNELATTAAFREAILAVPGVDRIDQLSATYEGTQRLLTVRWTVITVFGVTLSDSLSRGI